ncbi:uncharacterized protein LOC106779241 [Vigna radiata var. radiata]|uniref:Uncharacterized protein LOC106779241 n=1 Tax=Vigna radiata var. radiata TaxID=3916 RepID=A0A1S3VX88_VIGRR|nr:uncharacterized protein LOC106779241 [Vigna radiata var. radiata]
MADINVTHQPVRHIDVGLIVIDAYMSARQEDLELEREVEIINKPSIKSIHMESGQIVNCIDIYKQPSFDHPLLKDHKLQRKPNFQNPTGKTRQKALETKPMFGLGKDECPMGTVPILRTIEDDFIREKSLFNDHILVQDIPGVHIAEVALKPNYGPYYGVGGVGVCARQCGCVFVSDLVYIQTTTKGLDAICAGFIQTDRKVYLGATVTTISHYGGPIYTTAWSISQDPVTKNWWISIANKFIRYLPAKLFSNLNEASEVGWGGRTRTRPGTQSPQMGSGYFARDDNVTHACFFKEVSIQDNERKTHGAKVYETHSFSDSPNCYDVRYYGNQDPYYGYILSFGGPGGNCGN